MKIKNDVITLKIGKKQYNFNNLILDEYLKRFVLAQLKLNSLNTYSTMKDLKYCLLKFDESIESLSSSSKLKNQDFDICFTGIPVHNQIISENQITVEYLYTSDKVVWDYSKNTSDNNYISNYYGKKITAIGFNVGWMPYSAMEASKNYVCAVLDTSNYNIYLQENQELSITRRDVITSDALFYSNDKDKVPGPAHLSPIGLDQIIYQNNIYNENNTQWSSFYDRTYGVLYSVGLSSYIDYIDKEFIIGQDTELQNNGMELTVEGIENYLTKGSLLYPNSNLYPSSTLYPAKNNYKYLIFKYKVYQEVHLGSYNDIISESRDTGYYYHQAIPITKFGKSDFKIKYERG